MAEEYERFEITDYDLDNEFNPNRNRRRPTKKQQIYGIFAEDSDEDNGQQSGFKGSKGERGFKDYTAPVSFISGGVQQSGKKKEPAQEKVSDDEEDDSRRPGLAGKSKQDSSASEEEQVRPSFKPQHTAGMRQPTRGLPGSGKGLGNWEQHTRGIGAKLLLQMGYQPGKGLGKTLQGISAPVEAHVRKGRGAIGAYGPEKKTKPADLKVTGKKQIEDRKDGEKGEGRKQWSKKGGNKRNAFKSVEDVIEKGKKPDYMLYDSNNKLSKVTVIDMTGPEKRILSGYHAMNQAKVTEDDVYEPKSASDLKHFQLPELMHNLNLIVNMCEQDIIANDKRQRVAEDRQKSLENEKDHLERIVTLEKQYIETLEDSAEIVERLVDTDDPPTLDEAERLFIRLKVNHPNEYIEFGMGDLAPGVIAPLINARLKDWDVLNEPTKYVVLIKKWAGLLDYSSNSATTVFDPYPALVWSSIVPCIRRAAAIWNPRNHAPMAALLDTWSALLPDWMLDNVLEQIILTRLTQAVADWDPSTDIYPIHTWIHPWASILGAKMESSVYKTICDKLSKALRAWHPADRSARAMIQPWKNVFSEEDMQMFLHKNIVPKLEHRMIEIVFNPIQQDLEIFNQVWEWNELISPLVMSNILDKYFFPKWMQTLVLWLNQSPNFDEVSRWYTGWKGMLNEGVLRQPNVSEHFRRALDLMQRATGITMPAQAQEPVPPKPPSLMDLNIAPPPNLEFKEMLSQMCGQRDIFFAPVPGRREQGKPVYRIGKLFCYIEKSVCVVSLDGGITWTPISVEALLEKAITG